MILRILSGSRPAFALGGNIFLAGDNGPGGGGGGLTIKQQLDQANARIAELEPQAGKVAGLESQLTEANGKVTSLEADKTRISEELTEANGKVTTLTDQVSALEGEKNTLATQLEEQKTKATTAEENLKNADSRADSRLREAVAKSGGVLPPKDHKTGNPPDENADAGKPPAQRLASIFKVQG